MHSLNILYLFFNLFTFLISLNRIRKQNTNYVAVWLHCVVSRFLIILRNQVFRKSCPSSLGTTHISPYRASRPRKRKWKSLFGKKPRFTARKTGHPWRKNSSFSQVSTSAIIVYFYFYTSSCTFPGSNTFTKKMGGRIRDACETLRRWRCNNEREACSNGSLWFDWG